MPDQGSPRRRSRKTMNEVRGYNDAAAMALRFVWPA
jgi:hypothetical protein